MHSFRLCVNIDAITFYCNDKLQREPKVECFLREPNHSIRSCFPVIAAFNSPDKLEFTFETFDLNLADLFLCMDMYVLTKNSQGRWCRVRSGTANLPILSLSQKSKSFTLYNNAAEAEKGIVTCDFEIISSEEPKLTHENIDAILKRTNPTMRSLLTKRREQKKTLHSQDSFVPRIEMPYALTRFDSNVKLNGEAFFFNVIPLEASEDWYLYLIDTVLLREGLKRDDFNHMVAEQLTSESSQILDNKLVEIIGRVLALYPNSMPYIGDFEYSKSEQMILDDSFEETFSKGSGDCEDFAKDIMLIYHGFTRPRFPVLNETFSALQSLLKLYVPMACLGKVSRPGYNEARQIEPMAHMWVVCFPRSLISKKLNLNIKQRHPWENNLPNINIEGTGRVYPLFQPDKPLQDREINQLQIKRNILRIAQNINYKTTFEEHIDGVDKFYSDFVHAYTPYFVDENITDKDGNYITALTFRPENSTSYACPYNDVMTNNHFDFHIQQPMSPQQVEDANAILSFNHPLPHSIFQQPATIRHTQNKENLHKETFVDVFINHTNKESFVTFLNKTSAAGYTYDLFSEPLGNTRVRIYK